MALKSNFGFNGILLLADISKKKCILLYAQFYTRFIKFYHL